MSIMTYEVQGSAVVDEDLASNGDLPSNGTSEIEDFGSQQGSRDLQLKHNLVLPR